MGCRFVLTSLATGLDTESKRSVGGNVMGTNDRSATSETIEVGTLLFTCSQRPWGSAPTGRLANHHPVAKWPLGQRHLVARIRIR